MSYDISFKVKVEGVDIYVDVGHCGANITWNVRDMIKAATDLPWINEANNGLCTDIIPKIRAGYEELTKNPEKYRQYEPANKWGTVEGAMGFFYGILDAWEELLKWNEELIPVATFWIE